MTSQLSNLPAGQNVTVRQGPRTLFALEDEFRRAVIIHALDAHSGNLSAAARALGVQRPHLYRIIRALQIPRSRNLD